MRSEDFLKRDFIRGDPKLEAALEIARESHAGQKLRNGYDYIEHPLLVCNILDSFGATDTQKAVGLLHDVIEDRESYRLQPLRLEIDLVEALKKKCAPGTQEEERALVQWAQHVCEGVQQLSTGEYTFEGKRTTQVDAVKYMREEFRPVKIIDQAANVAMDVMYSDPRDLPELSNNKGFALKGLDLSRVLRGDDHDNPYHEFTKRVFNRFRDFYKMAKKKRYAEIEDLRANFDLESIVADSRNPAIREVVKPEQITQYYAPALRLPDEDASLNPQGPPKGLAHVSLSNTTGKVISFGLFASPPDKGNHVGERLLGMLERTMDQSVETGELKHPQELLKRTGEEYFPGDLRVREYTLAQPVDLSKLLRTAKKLGALDRRFEFELAPLSRNGDMQERAG